MFICSFEYSIIIFQILHLDQAHKVLRILRGPNWNVTAELTDIKVAADKSKANKRTWKPKDFLEKGVWKPFLIAIALMYFFQFTAINIVLMFTPDIFKMSDPQSKFIDEFLATILVGIALFVSNIITLLLADKMRRRLIVTQFLTHSWFSNFFETVTSIQLIC